MVLLDTMDLSQISPLLQVHTFLPVVPIIGNIVEIRKGAATSPQNPSPVISDLFLANPNLLVSQQNNAVVKDDELVSEIGTSDDPTTMEPFLDTMMMRVGAGGGGKTSGMKAKACTYELLQCDFRPKLPPPK